MEEDNTKGYLVSRIRMDATLLSSIRDVRRKLGCYPHLEMTGDGSSLRYVIRTGEKERFYILSLASDHLSLDLYSKSSPLYLLSETLLRALSISAILADDYEFYIRGLFPYLVETLSSQIPNPKVSVLKRSEYADPPEMILAKRINTLNRHNVQLEKDLLSVRSKFARATALLVISRYGPSLDLSEISRETGIDMPDLEEALRSMPDLGYKTMLMSHGRYSMVRI